MHLYVHYKGLCQAVCTVGLYAYNYQHVNIQAVDISLVINIRSN